MKGFNRWLADECLGCLQFLTVINNAVGHTLVYTPWATVQSFLKTDNWQWGQRRAPCFAMGRACQIVLQIGCPGICADATRDTPVPELPCGQCLPGLPPGLPAQCTQPGGDRGSREQSKGEPLRLLPPLSGRVYILTLPLTTL